MCLPASDDASVRRLSRGCISSSSPKDREVAAWPDKSPNGESPAAVADGRAIDHLYPKSRPSEILRRMKPCRSIGSLARRTEADTGDNINRHRGGSPAPA